MKTRVLLGLALVLAVAVVGLSIAADSEKAAPAEKACCAQAAAVSCCSAEGKACCSAEANSCCSGESGCPVASDAKTGCSSGGGCPLTALLGLGGSAESGCSSGGCSGATACSAEGCPLQAGCASGKACAAESAPIVCPVSGETASKAVKVAFNGADVYLCCAGCKAKFEKDPQKYAAKANHQLVSTGQAVQVACPVSGGKVNKDVKLKVAGVDVAFFCGGFRAEVAEAKADQHLQLVFGNEAFQKAFKIKKQPPKTQKPEQQAKKEHPEKNEKKS
ncbi:MAG TPA: hypothetical protein VMY37_19390 [Thermoguttaceae bacterium]|nr:hypothetical protein [Thermoguttaceae bacterium]